MAVGRQLNSKGQMRIDVPHLRLIESGVVYDFDTLAGGILAGKLPYVVTGFTPNAWVNGSAASSLSLVTAGSIFVNYNASENGSMLMVPADRAPETLTVVNSRVVGGFTVSQTNYVSLDLVRLEDDTTSDVVHFIDPATGQSTPKIIPLGRTMDYRIHISTTPFSATPQLCPVMIVDTDANNNIVSVEDARPMMYRLASGGDSPNPLGVYSWPQGRTESANSFVGGDKAITNMKDWASAVMQRIWELTGGEYWYSDVTDRNLKVYADNTVAHTRAGVTNNQIWDGTDITWSGFGIAFDNSTAYINEIANQTTASPGLTNIAAGECIYVDYDRSTNRLRSGSPLVPVKTTLSNLGTPAKPGVRVVLFWRPTASSKVYSRLDFLAVGQYSGAATTTTYGVVKLSSANPVVGGPFVAPTDASTRVIAAGITMSGTGLGGSLSIGETSDDVNIHIGSAFCNYLQIASGSLVGTSITSQGNISIESGVTTNLGQTIVESKQGILIGTGTNNATVTIGRSASTTQATSIYGWTVALRGGNGTNIATDTESTVTVGKSGAATQTTNIYGKTIRIGEGASSGVIVSANAAFQVVANRLNLSSTSSAANDYNILTSPAGVTTLVLDTVGASAASLFVVRNNSVDQFAVSAAGKVSAASATVSADVPLTLTTKGYVDSGGSPSWIAPTLNGTWTSVNFGYALSAGVVRFNGRLTSGAAPTAIAFTLPVGYRPTVTQSIFIAGYNSVGATMIMGIAVIDTTGGVRMFYAPTYASAVTDAIANQAYDFYGVSFPVW